MLGRLEVAQEGLRGELRNLHARGGGDRRVARHEQHPRLVAVLGREPLEQRVGVRREAHLERAALASSPTPSKTTTPRAPRIAT